MATKPPARPSTPARPQPPKPQGKPVVVGTNGVARPAAPARPAPQAVPARPAPAARPAPSAAPAARPAPPRPQTAPRPTLVRTPPPAPEPEIDTTAPEQQYGEDPGYDPNVHDARDAQEFEQEQPVRPAPAAPRPQAAPRPAAPRPQQAVARPAAPAIVRPSGGGLMGVTEGVRYDQLPEHMREDVHGGKDNIQSEDLGIVQYKLMQALSPEITEREDLRPGDFLHTGSGRNLGSVWHCALIHYQRQFILWNPLESGGGILARAADGIHWDPADMEWTVNLDKKDGGHTVTWRTARTVKESKLHLWGTMNPQDSQSPPAATKMLSFLALPWEFMEDGPAILTFQRSSLKKGSQLLSKIKMQRAPMFGVVYKIMSFPDTNKNGQAYMNQKAEAVGMIQDQALYEQFKTLNASFSQTGFELRDIESLQDEPVPDDGQGYDEGADENGDAPNY